MSKKSDIFWDVKDALFWYEHRLRVPSPQSIHEGDTLNIELAKKAIGLAYDWFETQQTAVPELVSEIKQARWNNGDIRNVSSIVVNNYHQRGFKIRTESILPWRGCKIYLPEELSDRIKSIISPKLEQYGISLDVIDGEEYYDCPLHWYTKDLSGSDKLIAFNTVMNYNNLILKS